jgi:hypothetical protein
MKLFSGKGKSSLTLLHIVERCDRDITKHGLEDGVT